MIAQMPLIIKVCVSSWDLIEGKQLEVARTEWENTQLNGILCKWKQYSASADPFLIPSRINNTPFADG